MDQRCCDQLCLMHKIVSQIGKWKIKFFMFIFPLRFTNWKKIILPRFKLYIKADYFWLKHANEWISKVFCELKIVFHFQLCSMSILSSSKQSNIFRHLFKTRNVFWLKILEQKLKRWQFLAKAIFRENCPLYTLFLSDHNIICSIFIHSP